MRKHQPTRESLTKPVSPTACNPPGYIHLYHTSNAAIKRTLTPHVPEALAESDSIAKIHSRHNQTPGSPPSHGSNLKPRDARILHGPAVSPQTKKLSCLPYAVNPARWPCSLPWNEQPSEICSEAPGPWTGKHRPGPGC